MNTLKAKIVPLQFREANEREAGEYEEQLGRLKEIYGDVADFSGTVTAGDPIPECDAVLFPQMIGAGYHYAEQLKSYDRPVHPGNDRRARRGGRHRRQLPERIDVLPDHCALPGFPRHL